MNFELLLSVLSASFFVYASAVYYFVTRKLSGPTAKVETGPVKLVGKVQVTEKTEKIETAKTETVKQPLTVEQVAVPKLAELSTEVRDLGQEVKTKTEQPSVSQETVSTVKTTSSLEARLSRTRGSLFGKLSLFFGKSAEAIPAAEWESLEEILLAGDVGVATTQTLLNRIRSRAKNGSNGRDFKDLIREESEALLAGLRHGEPSFSASPSPLVISVVGVNGAGKTTTIGKMAQRFHQANKKVLLGACDTFRAAAIGQLKVWAERSQSQFVTGREGADPGAVAFDSVTAGKARGVDIVLLDTAGRLHTKTNLMEELKKIHRVVKKVIPEAPHETWLVLDGTSGQNAVQQAREFQKALELTGVIITKLDGTAKGGAILSVAADLKLPIKYIGVGEGIEDLIPFEPHPFVAAILGENSI